MPIIVKKHPRRGTRGVRKHSRNISSQKKVPHNRDMILSPKEIASIEKILDKNKLVKSYSIKKATLREYIIVDVNFKTEKMDFGGGIPDPNINDYSIMFNIDKSNDYYNLTAYRSYHFGFDHKFDTLYRKKVKRFSTVTKNIEETSITS